MSKRLNKPKKKKKPEFDESAGKSFDSCCRANGIPVRADFDTEIQYRKARRKAGLA